MARLDIDSILETDVLSKDGDLVLSRGVAQDSHARVLTVRPTSEHPSPAVLGRLAHEYDIRDDLDSAWAANPIAASKDHLQPVLVLADPGAEPLALHVGDPMEVGRFLEIATGLASALRQMHECGVIHKDLKPANILVDAATSRVWLTGFGYASNSPREHQTPMSTHVIAGTFPYMAPEQTGRMNRSVDSRSDLYSLGIVLYEMLTGALPFTAAEPSEWVYCHLAMHPAPPVERVPSIPEPLSDLVLKLLAKNAEERYQSAAGVEWDLRRCLHEWQSTGDVPAFELGTEDVALGLMIPERLYGREREHAMLVEALNRVVRGGVPEFVLVSGYSGIGKSALVQELMKEAVAEHTFFLSGKYDQYKRDIPFATIAQAFGAMVRQILRGSEARIATWREAILDVAGRNAQVLVDLIPELEWLIGPQPPVIELGPTEARNRFQELFQRFVGVSATADHPIVLFLDDLQWIDPASLGLLEHLAAQRESRHLLVVGAYRENEVGPTHPLALKLESLRKTSAILGEIVLRPLGEEDVLALVADAIRADRVYARPLAEHVFQRTSGNPFFVVQFLMSLADERLLTYDREARSWVWDLDKIRALGHTDDVVDFMVDKLQRLSAATLERLRQLASLGSSAHLATLALISGDTEEGVARDLDEAVRAGFVARSGDTYRFLHDRIQEASYSLIPAESRPAWHLEIGRTLRSSLDSEALDESVFDVVDHLNRGAELIEEGGERQSLGWLNAVVGRKAKASVAYAAAQKYLENAASLLGDRVWETDCEEALALTQDLAECEFLTSNLERADELLDLAYAHTESDLERAHVLRLRMRTYQGRRSEAALEVGLEALRLLGIAFPEKDDEILSAFMAEQQAFWERLGDRTVADLYDLPVATDPTARAMMDLLAELGACAYNVRPVLTTLIYVTGLNLALRWGNTEATCMTYISYGSLSVSLGNIPVALAFADLALRLNEKFGDLKLRGTLLYVQGVHVSLWKRPMATSKRILEEGFLACREVGDLAFAAHTAAALVSLATLTGEPLGEVVQAARRYALFCREWRNDVIYQWVRLGEHMAANLMDATATRPDFDADEFGEARYLEVVGGERFYTGLASFYLHKQIAAVMHGCFEEALEAEKTFSTFAKAVRSGPLYSAHQFYHCLTLTSLHPSVDEDRKREFEATLAAKLEMLRFWAEHAPENYACHHTLVRAEVARIEGCDLEAMRLYDEAIRSARESGFVHVEGLAAEFAARFHRERGFDRIALAYLRDARLCYARWGAEALVARLDRDNPTLAETARASSDVTADTTVERLDLVAVLKASQAVSNDIVLDRLIETLMTISLEHAGADRGLLVLAGEGEQRIAALASAGDDGVQVAVCDLPATSAQLPESVLNYVIRTHERVLIDAAMDSDPFPDDEYLRAQDPKSVLCLPLLKQGVLVGVLYLENHLTPGAFTADRTAVLELLASQAAISLENATLYANLQREQEAIRELNASLEQRVADRTMELEEARDRADEASRSKSEFLANMSHELRTPLNAVIGFAQLLEADRRISGASREQLGIIQKSGEHLLGLINDVLSISKIEAGKLSIIEKPFDLPATLRAVQAIVEVRAQPKGLAVVFDLDPRLPQVVLGDEGKLRQVLINLLGNGVKFTDRGTVTLRARARSLSSENGADGCRVHFDVEDTGQGIAEEEMGRLFEAFGQTESGRRAQEGTGLGLVISRQIVRLMGGDIAVRSRLGEGTVFTFEVGLSVGQAARTDGPERTIVGLAPDQAPLRILVVDDVDVNRRLLAELLGPIGFEVREAANGREALDVWSAWRPDLIFMDIRMSVMDGREATRRIREIEADEPGARSRPTKIVAVTASAFEHEREEILAEGIDDFVTKPFRVATIHGVIAQQLGVRYRYEEAASEDERAPKQADAIITADRLGALPPEQLRELYEALAKGDFKAAGGVAEAIAAADQALGSALLGAIRAFEFEDLLVLFSSSELSAVVDDAE